MLPADRLLTNQMKLSLKPGRLIFLLGAHGVGKTDLLQQLLEDFHGKSLLLNGEEGVVRQVMEKKTSKLMQRFLGDVKLLAIDEAHSIAEIESVVKLIFKEIPDICLVLCSGSSVNLKQKFGKLLQQLTTVFYLHALTQGEIMSWTRGSSGVQYLEERLLFGNYPGQFMHDKLDARKQYLKEFVDTYLLKDLLEIDGFRGTTRMAYMLQLLSLQIGYEISSYELGKNLGMSRNTAEKYLNYLSDAFIIFKLPSFSRSNSRELSKTNRWYFYDNGVRNALINNFSSFGLRNDRMQLWENYCISERMKKHALAANQTRMYFWKTYEKQEISLIEELNDQLYAFNIQWEEKDFQIPKQWKTSYPDAICKSIGKEDYPKWLM